MLINFIDIFFIIEKLLHKNVGLNATTLKSANTLIWRYFIFLQYVAKNGTINIEKVFINLKFKFMKKMCLITEGFGHGFASLMFANTYGLTPVAFSDKETEEEFTAQVNQIVNNLSFFAPNMVAATWENREEYVDAFNFRKELLAGNITAENWQDMAYGQQLVPSRVPDNLPKFASLAEGATMFVPQKLVSDEMCGTTAAQQSLSPEVFEFLKGETLVLGQHFHKVDLPAVEALARDFDLYVPGFNEDTEVLGIRGVKHAMYWNLYSKVAACVGIAGTHTWYLLACHPEVPQVILYNTKTVEKWKDIEAAWQEAGSNIRCIGFDENTDMTELSEKIAKAFAEI